LKITLFLYEYLTFLKNNPKSNKYLIRLMFAFVRFFWPNYALLQIKLSRFNGNTSKAFANLFFFLVPYWHALESAWPWKLSSKPQSSQFTTNFNVNVVEFKFAPSSFTNVLFSFLSYSDPTIKSSFLPTHDLWFHLLQTTLFWYL
jgi:hypothetical protein